MALHWFADDITEIELEAIKDLGDIAYDHEPVASRVVGMPWFEDGITEMEAAAIDDLDRIAFDNGAAADRVVDLAWFTDGLTMTEANVIQKLRLISKRVGLPANESSKCLSWPRLSQRISQR